MGSPKLKLILKFFMNITYIMIAFYYMQVNIITYN